MITTHHEEFGGIAVSEEQRPGTVDVRWAEQAPRHPRRTDQRHSIQPLPPRRRPRGDLRHKIAAVGDRGNRDRSCHHLIGGANGADADQSTVRPPTATLTRSKHLGVAALHVGWDCCGPPAPTRGRGDVG
jgi:hypothetical protein